MKIKEEAYRKAAGRIIDGLGLDDVSLIPQRHAEVVKMQSGAIVQVWLRVSDEATVEDDGNTQDVGR